MMIQYRRFRWPQDHDRLDEMDVSYTTHRVYAVEAMSLGFALVETVASPPVTKRYPVRWSELTECTVAFVAERDELLLGAMGMTYHEWNRRAVISHLYVDRAARSCGIGTQLLDIAKREAEMRRARCLWVETQNVNAAAIRFYQRNAFTLCGMDRALYDPREAPDETAVFFSSPLIDQDLTTEWRYSASDTEW
jgi:ribosomal protein S18 acetylase RimI-like enzyme